MYSNLMNVQYLVAALKANNITDVVVSPGNSHNAIVRSLEEDSFFKTYSVVDERSAAFFAVGLASELDRPVALCCTSGTAATNYMSGVTEAYRRNIPLVVITGDKNQYYLAQYEDQMIDQISIFKSITRYGCCLPIVANDQDAWQCRRLLSEAFGELDHHGKGPVHIDVPIEKGMLALGADFSAAELPAFRQIRRHELSRMENANDVFARLNGKRVMILCGQDNHVSPRECELVEAISKRYNCVFATDKLSNLHCGGTLEITRAMKYNPAKVLEFMPDVIISIAGNTALDYKFKLKTPAAGVEHWIVNEEGRIADPFRKLTDVFEGTTLQFLEAMAQGGVENADRSYFETLRAAGEGFQIPDFAYSNLYALNQLMGKMPQNSNFHISNSTTIRLAQFFDLDSSIEVHCNRGVNGIDGCASAFVGQAAASPDRLNFLCIGDLTFFYDMNSIWNRHVGKNLRIMLNNNEGAALFHFNQGLSAFPTLNRNVAAEHFATAEGWVKSQGFRYLSAHNKQEFDQALEQFLTADSDCPIFFEVFTKKEQDAALQHEFFDMNVEKSVGSAAKDSVKKILKSVLRKN